MLALETDSLIDCLASLPIEQQKTILSEFSDDEIASMFYDWGVMARPNQLPPDGDWRIWLLLAGRGFGKTRTGRRAG